MAYIRLMVLALAFEVLVIAVVGLGVYWGFGVFPFTQQQAAGQAATGQTGGFQVAVPLYMPSLSELKIPHTLLQTPSPEWGITAYLVSAGVVALQSFVRGMYLGGLKGWISGNTMVPLLASGRRYFAPMLAWAVFQALTGAAAVFLAAAFFPLGIAALIALLFFSFTPYLVVLQDLPFGEALGNAPRVFRRHFWALLPLALAAMLFTLLIGLLKSLPYPAGYALPLLLYAVVGTGLIAELMTQLQARMRADGEVLPASAAAGAGVNRTAVWLCALLLPLLAGLGTWAAAGRHLPAFDFGDREARPGIMYHSNFSDVVYASELQYTSYEWRTGEFGIELDLPDLSGGRKPGELRGIAAITWDIDRDRRIMSGGSTKAEAKPVLGRSRIMYRLVRETADDGSVYYSSRYGSASILPGGDRPYEPLSVVLVLSGDGRNLFVLQYPSRFDIQRLFLVAGNGRYLIPRANEVNPFDFRTYWFAERTEPGEVFDLLAAKNRMSFMPTANRVYVALATALQEADGRKVVELLGLIRGGGANVRAPEWDEREWTDYLRGLYAGADLQETLAFVSKAGIYGSYDGGPELPDQSSETVGFHRFEVLFPGKSIPITYKESKTDGRLLAVSLLEPV